MKTNRLAVRGEEWFSRIPVRARHQGPGGQVIISTDGGEEMVWSRAGSELFYRNGDQLMVVVVSPGETFSAERPVPLFEAPYAFDNAGGGAGNPNYDISPDGQQFIFVEQDPPASVVGGSRECTWS